MDADLRVNALYLSSRLRSRLADAARCPVTTIIAPTGYGKTTAAQYLQRRIAAEAPDAYLFRQFLSGGGRQEFWAGLCRALHTAPQLPAQLRALGYPDSPHTRQQLLELVQDALAGKPPVWFILDDVHLLSAGEAAELVSFLAERLPPQAHLILLSRNQIFSEAQKLRLGSRLLELGAADLRLTQEELLQYAGRCGLPLPEREAQALLSVSEGWIAMIYLMFRAYAQTGVWRFDAKGMDALMEQVMFEPLDERRRFFLLDICMAEAFTAEQAAFVWREPDADALLHDLTHNNAFIIESSPGVYRCHHMLRQLLRRKFALLPQDAQADACGRLGSWYERTGGISDGCGAVPAGGRLGRAAACGSGGLRQVCWRRAPADAAFLVPRLPGGCAAAAPGRGLRADAQALFLPRNSGAAASAGAAAGRAAAGRRVLRTGTGKLSRRMRPCDELSAL